MLLDESQTGIAIVLHRVGKASAAEHAKAVAPKELVLLDAVVLVPDPIRVAIVTPIRNELGERLLGDESVSDEIISFAGAPIARAAVADHDVMSFVDEAKREPETRVVQRRDNESH